MAKGSKLRNSPFLAGKALDNRRSGGRAQRRREEAEARKGKMPDDALRLAAREFERTGGSVSAIKRTIRRNKQRQGK